MKTTFALLAAALLATHSHAGIIASTDFDDTVKSAASQTMTGIDWTGDDLVAVIPNTEVTTVASNNAGYFTSGFGATGFAPDQNIENEGPWSATFEIVLNGTTTGTLTSIAFDYAALNNSGGSQGSNFRAQNFDITVNGNVYDAQQQTTAVNGSLTFTDAAALNNGLNQIVITSSEVSGPGYNMGIDNLVFNGDLVPEPTSLALLTLGGLLVARRRR